VHKFACGWWFFYAATLFFGMLYPIQNTRKTAFNPTSTTALKPEHDHRGKQEKTKKKMEKEQSAARHGRRTNLN
jgi:hypothetical protein